MQRIDFWGKLHIYGHKVTLCFLFVIGIASSGFSQAEKKMYGRYTGAVNLPYYDDKRFHFGFTLGLNTTRLVPTPSKQYFANDTISSVQSKNNGGFSLGFIVNYRLADYWDLRLLPTVAFYERDVEFNTKAAGSTVQANESAYIELPLLVKFKSQRRRNSRMYTVAGLKPGIETGAKKKDKSDQTLRLNSSDLAIDYGVGVDIYYPLFKFSPEIRISHGLTNMLIHDPNAYSQSLMKLTTHTVTLYLHFE